MANVNELLKEQGENDSVFSTLVNKMLDSQMAILAGKSGMLKALHPVTSLITFLNSIGTRENKAAKEAELERLIASGLDKEKDAEAIEKALKVIRKDYSNERSTVPVLQRIHSKAAENGLSPYELNADDYVKCSRLFKQALSANQTPYAGTPTIGELAAAIDATTERLLQNWKDAPFSAGELGITPMATPIPAEMLVKSKKSAAVAG